MSAQAFSLRDVDLGPATDHPVLAETHTYEIVGIAYRRGAIPFGTLEVNLDRDGERVSLEFQGAHELEVDAGFPFSCSGIEILDTSYIGREESAVRLHGFEDAPGLRCWARSVIRR